MISKKPGLTLQIVLGVLMLIFAAVACNNSGDDKKDAAADSVKPAETVTPAPVDTPQKMDTASTRPVKPGN